MRELFTTIIGAFGQSHASGGKQDTERAQAIVRLVLVIIVVIYLASRQLAHELPGHEAKLLLVYFIAFMAVSILLLLAIVKWPGVYHARRWFAMAHDYTAITFAMVVGGQAMLPIYAVLLWVTVGNGMRYGPRYLAAATAVALTSLTAIAYLDPYWREQPYLLFTLYLTTIIVPAYANTLLNQTRRASEAAARANLDKSRFLAQASHDLRQPIHAISLFTACLRDGGLPPGQKQMVDNIDKSLQAVSGLFRSLLDISTLDSGKVTARMQTVAIGQVLKDVALRNSEAAKWAQTEIRIVPTRLLVRADPDLVATMVQNLVSNALKYARGRPVVAGCRRRGDTVSIEIHDQGRGIPEEHLSRVFEEFYRVRNAGGDDVEGVGLGLSIVKRLAGLMELQVGIRSRPGRGTAVSIRGFPVVPQDGRVPARTSVQPAGVLDGMNVLLVEDDKDVLLATATLLEKWGCKVQAESAPPAAVIPCDLIITDFDLDGGVNGVGCIEQVRRLAGRPVPAIVMTGHNAEAVRGYLDDEATPILSKPIRPAELRSALVAQRLG